MEREGSFRYEEALAFMGVSLFLLDMQRQIKKEKKEHAYSRTHSRVTSFIHPSSHANMLLILFCLVIRLQRFLSQLFLLFWSQKHKVSKCWDPAPPVVHTKAAML